MGCQDQRRAKTVPLLDCKCHLVSKSFAHCNVIRSLFQGWWCSDRTGGFQESRRHLAERVGLFTVCQTQCSLMCGAQDELVEKLRAGTPLKTVQDMKVAWNFIRFFNFRV